MYPTMTFRSAALAGIRVAVLLVLLTTALAGPALAAPRAGITAARGVAAEARATPAGATFSTHRLGSAAIAAPLPRSESYGVMPWAAAWAIGAVGAVTLIGGASAIALARRRSQGVGLAELPASGPAGVGSEQRDEQHRRAA